MTAIRWASGLIALLCMVLVLVRMRADGVLVLATVFVAVWFWSCGVFSRAFWVADAGTSERLAVVDEEIRFADSVGRDLDRLTRGFWTR